MTTPQDAANTASRAAIYMRFATADPAGRKAAVARHACEHRAKELGAAVVAEYSDVSSGWTDQRKQLKWTLADLATASDIGYVIVPDHSMVARNIQVYARIVWRIEQAGARLVIASVPLEDYQAMASNPLGLQQAVADWASNENPDAPGVRRVRRRTASPGPAGWEVGESTGTSTDQEVRHD